MAVGPRSASPRLAAMCWRRGAIGSLAGILCVPIGTRHEATASLSWRRVKRSWLASSLVVEFGGERAPGGMPQNGSIVMLVDKAVAIPNLKTGTNMRQDV